MPISKVTPLGMYGGAVLQVVQSVKTSAQSTTSTSYVDITDLSVTITPTSSSSKILVMARINNISNSLDYGTFINLVRGSTTLTSSTAGGVADTKDAWAGGGGGMGGTGNSRQKSSCAIDYLDSPATTSSTTYKMQMVADSGSTATVNQWALNTDVASVSSITLMEIAV